MGTAGAGQQPDFSGTFWEKISKPQRTLYVMGVLEGMDFERLDIELALFEKAKKHPPVGATSKTMEKWVINFAADNRLKKRGDNITVAQIISGITTMYDDYRNQQIPIVCLIDVVIKSIKGASKEEIENLLGEMRRNLNAGSAE